jgi:protein TonB
MIVTFAFNAAILLALILIPLFYPEALPRMAMTILMTAPPTPVDEPRPVVRPANAAPVQTEITDTGILAPSRIPKHIYEPDRRETSTPINAASLAGEGPGPAVFHGPGTGQVVVQAQAGPQHISRGVAAGLLIHRVVPQYPAIPREMHLEGTVVLQATISKSGTIENLRVVSGPALLQQAALDAVAQWRYRPYLLNGEPVEVETTVNVEFTLQ